MVPCEPKLIHVCGELRQAVNLLEKWLHESLQLFAEAKVNERSQKKKKNLPVVDPAKTSLILFDEVDVVLSDDRGFWNAIETFMSITKRPIVMTASDPQFMSRFPCHVELLKLHVPQHRNVASYLQTLCLAEGFRTSFEDLLSLTSLLHGDVRRALLALQVWLEPGSALCHSVAAPVYGPNPSTATKSPSETDSSPKVTCDPAKPTPTQVSDSGDEFVEIRKCKRRARQIASSDEDSQSATVMSAAPLDPDTEDHRSCQSHREISPLVETCHKELTGDVNGIDSNHCPVIMGAQVAPPIRRLDLAMIGGLESVHKNCYHMLQFERQEVPVKKKLQLGSLFCTKQNYYSCFLPNMWNAENGLRQLPGHGSVRNLYAAYKTVSLFDNCSRKYDGSPVECSNFIHPGTSDSFPSSSNSDSLWKQSSWFGEMREMLEDATFCAGREWQTILSSGGDATDAQKPAVDMEHFDKLADSNSSLVEYVQSRQGCLWSREHAVEVLPALRAIAKAEEVRKATNRKRRFYHYLRSAFPDIKPSLLNDMCRTFSVDLQS